METIGFHNFRNFQEFKTLPLNGVTFLVGPNNSGKSTITKACRLLGENIPKTLLPTYVQEMKDYDNTTFGRFNFTNVCKNYERAKNISSSDNEGMTFNCQCGYFDIEIEPSKNGKIKRLSVHDIIDDCTWTYCKNEHGNAESTLEYSNTLLLNILKNIKKKEGLSKAYISKLENIIEKLNSDNYTQHQVPFNDGTTNDAFKSIPFRLESGNLFIRIENGDYHVTELLNYFAPQLKDFINYNFGGDLCLQVITNKYLIDVAEYFNRIAQDYQRAVSDLSERVVYIHAFEHEIRSSFMINDSDHISSIISNFYKRYYNSGDKSISWIKKWMNELGIGKDFKITSTDDSEILSVKILNMNNQLLPLADIGRGTTQIFLLLLRMVTIVPFELVDESPAAIQMQIDIDSYPEEVRNHQQNIKKTENEKFPDGYKRYSQPIKTLLIVEEPEQNLHPALQSKLADLFLSVYKEFGINIIIETHSEYLIRRSQVLVAEAKYKSEQELKEKCPFKVYYLPEVGTGKPYNMEYRTDGNFENDFGTGFYDVASDLAFQTF